MGLSGAVVRSALGSVGAVGGQIGALDVLAGGAADALSQAPPGLTVQGAAAFLATCAQESAWFRTTTEFGTGQSYAPYIGRTFIQLTFRDNYQAFGDWCHARGLVSDPATFATNPAALSDLRWAWLGPIFYFAVHDLWRWANAGDFLAVSQAVNLGIGKVGTASVPNGWAERQKTYAAFLAAGDDLLPSGSTTGEDDPMSPIPLAVAPDGHFAETVQVEGSAISVVADASWVTYGCTWGGTVDFVLTALDGKGGIVGAAHKETVENNHRGAPFPVPPTAAMVTIEGVAHNARPSAALVTKAR